MNYYKRHLGDYARDTGHLTALEHGIYGLLLDWYYANEKPIPADKAVRIARGNPDETQSVLSEFFKLTPDGWRHSYADRIIREYNAKADRNREVGKLGGRPSKTQTVSKEKPQETLATSHKPLANKEQKKKPPARAEPVFLIAPEWLDADAWGEWCQYRKGKKWTPRAQALSIAKLRDLMLGGSDPPSVIRQSIAAGWTGLFPLKTGIPNEANRRLSPAEQVRAHIARSDAASAGLVNGHANPVAEDGRDLRPPLDGEFWRESGH